MRLRISQAFLLAASVSLHAAELSDEALSAFYRSSLYTLMETCTLHNRWQHAREHSNEGISVTSIPA